MWRLDSDRVGVASARTDTPAELRPSAMARWAGALSGSLRHQAGVLSIAILFIAAAVTIGTALGMPTRDSLWAYLPTYMVLMPVSVATLLLLYCIYIVVRLRPARPLLVFLEHLRDRLCTRERIAMALPLLIVVPIFGGAFTLLKAAIPRINPYSWDRYFAELDRSIHFGGMPWELLHPVLGQPEITWIIGWLYGFWFFALALVWTWQAFSLSNRLLRLQFFYSLLLIWILFGAVAATALASGGPCYYGNFVSGDDPFRPLMDYLHAVNAETPISAIWAQEMLWDNYLNRDVRLGGGISAMPSIHVAMSFLFVLVAWRAFRWLRWLTLAYFFVILFGSVHLGWHYAIDGYAVIPGVMAVWWIAGRLAAASPSFSDETVRP